MKRKDSKRRIPKITFVPTDHFMLRTKERMPSDFELPKTGEFVRLFTVRDTLHQKKLLVLLVKGGAILGRWHGPDNHIVIVTAFDEDTLHRLQKRKNSRFIPVNAHCYQVN